VKKNIRFDDHKNCVLNDIPKNVKINAMRILKSTNGSLAQDKLALSNRDDKRVWFDKTLIQSIRTLSQSKKINTKRAK
jgi:hypothetical protein